MEIDKDEAYFGFDGEMQINQILDQRLDDFWEIEQTYGNGDSDWSAPYDE